MKTGKAIRSFILRRAGFIVLFGVLSSVVMGWYTVKIFSNLRTELEELLPSEARSVLDMEAIQSRLESTNNLVIITLSQNPAMGKKWVDDLSLALQSLPKDIASGVEYRIDDVLQFFQSRRSLFIETDDLRTIKDYIQHRISYEKQLWNPLTFLENLSLKEPRFDFNVFQKKYTSKTDAYTHFPDGYYASPDQRTRIVIVNLPANTGGIASAKRLRAAVDEVILKLDPKKYGSGMEVHFSGGVQDLIEEHEALVADLILSTLVVCGLVGLAMLIYFRSLVATFTLIFSLIVGTLWTFGLGYFEIGYLNANTAFMASIVIGNGINFGIILLARYIEERRKKNRTPRALLIALKKTFPATVVAAAAAALSYGSLLLTSFRGFQQFGVIGFTGMMWCWLASYTLMPALMICFYRLGFLCKEIRQKSGRFSSLLATSIQKFSKPILAFTVLLTIFSVMMFSRIDSSVIETDMKKLRNAESLKSGSIYWSKFADEVFRRYLSPLVILPNDPAHVLPIQKDLRAIQKTEGAKSFIANVSTIHDFVPPSQNEKIRILRQIRELLTPRIRFEMGAKDRRLVDELLSPDSMRPFTSQELPELVKSKFRERDGTIGKLVLVEPVLSDELSKSQPLIHFVNEVRVAADRTEPGAPVAGELTLTADMFESILRDGPKTTLFAFMAVFLLIVILFREPGTIFLCAFSLILGVLWLIGILMAVGEKINFLNFIALPITFGIGVDYGINIFQRYRQEKRDGIVAVLQHTGGAVMLASLTTVIGYGSLIIAQNQAFVSFGTVAILGECCCVFAAVFSLPALLLHLKFERKRRVAHGILGRENV